jgi:hypothetical protein
MSTDRRELIDLTTFLHGADIDCTVVYETVGEDRGRVKGVVIGGQFRNPISAAEWMRETAANIRRTATQDPAP